MCALCVQTVSRGPPGYKFDTSPAVPARAAPRRLSDGPRGQRPHCHSTGRPDPSSRPGGFIEKFYVVSPAVPNGAGDLMTPVVPLLCYRSKSSISRKRASARRLPFRLLVPVPRYLLTIQDVVKPSEAARGHGPMIWGRDVVSDVATWSSPFPSFQISSRTSTPTQRCGYHLPGCNQVAIACDSQGYKISVSPRLEMEGGL